MSRFNKRPTAPQVASPVKSQHTAWARTANNAPGFERDAKSELFLLAVSNFVGQDTFYEKGKVRDQRFVDLVRKVAVSDPLWMARFLPWLRNEANMRTAAIIGAVEFAKMRLLLPSIPAYELPGVTSDKGLERWTIAQVLQRADEPGEMVGYAGHRLPKPVKRGIADAVRRLYNERNTLKYDTDSHAFRFGDVLELTHAAPDKPYQTVLFKHLIDRRHGRDGIPSSLTMMHLNAKMRQTLARGHFEELGTEWIRAAGFTWEDVLSLVGDRIPKSELWEALIPAMGYMALLRNLRNFDQAGVSDKAASAVNMKLSDPDEVARSRQLPMRFLSAYRTAPSLRWGWALEQALEASLGNVPEFKGRTLILIDTSGSMQHAFSRDGELRFWDAAAMFGLAVARRCHEATVVSFANQAKEFPLITGESLLKSVERFKAKYFFGGGTATKAAVDAHYNSHDRVIILTDEQANHHGYQGVADKVPHNKMVVTFNLAGYQVGHERSGSDTRVTVGGLTDQAFRLLPILEKRAAGQWPF